MTKYFRVPFHMDILPERTFLLFNDTRSDNKIIAVNFQKSDEWWVCNDDEGRLSKGMINPSPRRISRGISIRRKCDGKGKRKTHTDTVPHKWLAKKKIVLLVVVDNVGSVMWT